MPRTISFLGSVALLVSNITGPSLVIIPLLFQQAGWLTPLLTFAAIALLSGTAALFLIEAMSSIEGNETFQASIEFTTIAHLFLGKRWHIIVQGLLFLAMQSMVIASLLVSFQSMDAFLISVAHKTCAVSFTDGWVCVNQISPNSNSAFSGYILGSFGTLITISLILPLSLIQLVDNIIFQVASFIVLLIITIAWIIILALKGLNTHPIPVVGHDQSTVAGFVLSNFSFVTTVPAWVNNTHPSVNIRLAVWLSVLISCLIYIPIGWMGGSAFALPNNATLLQVFTTDMGHGALHTAAQVSSYLFPLAVLITSVPVFTIVVRYNLLRGNIFSNKMAIFWSAIFPWLIVIPFQTNGGLATILNWASLIFTSPSNLLVPFILFIVSKRHLATAVLDANVSPAMAPPPEVDVSSTPVSLSTALGRTTTPVEHIPVVIITNPTETDLQNTIDVKSKESEEPGASALDMIPMSVMNRVSSPSKHRYYGQEFSSEGGESSTGDGGTDLPGLIIDTVGKSSTQSHRPPRPSVSIPRTRSPSLLHSSTTGMDEFLLMSRTPTETWPQGVRTGFTAHNTPSDVDTDTGMGMELESSPSGWSSGVTVLPGTSPPASDEYHHHHYIPSASLDAPPDAADVRLSMSPPMMMMDMEESVPRFKAFPSLSPNSLIRPTRISVVACVLTAGLVLTAIIYGIIQAAQGGSGG